MNHQVTTLKNGLRVVSVTMPQAYSATVSVATGVGSRYEQFKQNGGVSHFLEHLFFKGTKKRPSTKIISEQVDAVGGYSNAYTSNELTNYYIKVPYQQVQLAMDILADMMRNSLFDADEIDRERGVVLEEMNVYRDDPASHVHSLTPHLLWPGHPLAEEVIGNEKVIKSVKRDEIMAYRDRFYQPGNMVVSAAGRVDHDKLVEMAEKLYGDMQNTAIPESPKVQTILTGNRTKTLTQDTAQSHLAISTVAYPYRHPKEAASRLMAAILGRGLSSRLFLNVRERKGLAYRVNAGLETFTDTGAFEVYAGVGHDKVPEAIGAICEELRIISTQPVPEGELNKAKNQIRGGLQMAMESNSAVVDRLAGQMTLLGSVRSVEETLAELDAVTAVEVQKVAAEILSFDRLRMGIISPNPAPAVKAFRSATSK